MVEMNNENDFLVSQLELIEKEIEPSQQNNKERISRNLQLANMPKDLFNYYHYVKRNIIILDAIPKNKGGFLSLEVSNILYQDLDMASVMTGGLGGFLRRMMKSRITNQTIKDESPKQGISSFGFGGNR